MEKQKILDDLAAAVVEGDEDLCREGATQALDNEIDPLEAVEEGLPEGGPLLPGPGLDLKTAHRGLKTEPYHHGEVSVALVFVHHERIEGNDNPAGELPPSLLGLESEEWP